MAAFALPLIPHLLGALGLAAITESVAANYSDELNAAARDAGLLATDFGNWLVDGAGNVISRISEATMPSEAIDNPSIDPTTGRYIAVPDAIVGQRYPEMVLSPELSPNVLIARKKKMKTKDTSTLAATLAAADTVATATPAVTPAEPPEDPDKDSKESEKKPDKKKSDEQPSKKPLYKRMFYWENSGTAGSKFRNGMRLMFPYRQAAGAVLGPTIDAIGNMEGESRTPEGIPYDYLFIATPIAFAPELGIGWAATKGYNALGNFYYNSNKLHLISTNNYLEDQFDTSFDPTAQEYMYPNLRGDSVYLNPLSPVYVAPQRSANYMDSVNRRARGLEYPTLK